MTRIKWTSPIALIFSAANFIFFLISFLTINYYISSDTSWNARGWYQQFLDFHYASSGSNIVTSYHPIFGNIALVFLVLSFCFSIVTTLIYAYQSYCIYFDKENRHINWPIIWGQLLLGIIVMLVILVNFIGLFNIPLDNFNNAYNNLHSSNPWIYSGSVINNFANVSAGAGDIAAIIALAFIVISHIVHYVLDYLY